MLSAARRVGMPFFAGWSSGRMAISDLRPLNFCAAATISAVTERSSDFERDFLPQPTRNRTSAAARPAKIRSALRERKFTRPVAAASE